MPTAHAPRIAFVGNFEHDGGSANALYGYVRAARRLGHDVRASSLGPVDHAVRSKVPLADADWVPDLMVLTFEAYQFLTSEALERIERVVPRSRRVVIDQDGMYSAEVRVGSDTNHPDSQSRESWAALFARLSDTILQPCLAPTTPGVQSFLFFGFDRQNSYPAERLPEKPYDVLYVGNNWLRWHDMVWLCEEVASIRGKLGRTAVFGKWWTGERLHGWEDQTFSDPSFLRSHGVEVHPAVAFDQVEATMGLGRVNPVFVRPVLNALGLLTPRMFETFAADTIPLLPPYLHGAMRLYGDEVSPLCLIPDVSMAERLLTILDQHAEYVALVREIAEKLEREHSYEVRLEQLLAFAP